MSQEGYHCPESMKVCQLRGATVVLYAAQSRSHLTSKCTHEFCTILRVHGKWCEWDDGSMKTMLDQEQLMDMLYLAQKGKDLGNRGGNTCCLSSNM